MTTEVMEQGSDEWLRVRMGKVTASRVADVVAKTKSGWGASRANYMAQLIAERLTNVPAESFTNAAMQWGTEKEPEARDAYAFLRGVSVETVAFVEHPKILMSGASPDGLIGDAGLVEIKCPNTATHIETLLNGGVAGKYVTQMQWQMACTGRAWCDFVSYDPRLSVPMDMHIFRVERDEVMINQLEMDVAEFLNEIEDKISRLKSKFKKVAA